MEKTVQKVHWARTDSDRRPTRSNHGAQGLSNELVAAGAWHEPNPKIVEPKKD